ncbi:MAG: DUF4342 domain-containing protein [Bacillota bacterium]
MEELAKIDIIRERTNLSYGEARELLAQHNGDLVAALISMEKEGKIEQQQWKQKGNELLEKIKEVIHRGNITKIKVTQNEQVILEVPVTAGVVGTLLAPQLAIVGAATALFTGCRVEFESGNMGGGADIPVQ